MIDLPAKKSPAKTLFQQYVGIDYSGAGTAGQGLPGLRVYQAIQQGEPIEVRAAASSPRIHWSRRAIAEWLDRKIAEGIPTIIGVDHGFGFPQQYFEKYRLPGNWDAFLDDFQRHWPVDTPGLTVETLRGQKVKGSDGRVGDSRWRRLCDIRARAKSVFHFDVPGSVAKSTHAGLPWLRYLRKRHPQTLHVWPFDGWIPPQGSSLIAEVYPSQWNDHFPRDGRTPDQHDAYVVAATLQRSDRHGQLENLLQPHFAQPARRQAQLEGWILGLPGSSP